MKRKGILIALLISLVIGVFASPFASSFPDGLEWVAEKLGFLDKGEGKEIIASPLPDYTIPFIHNEKVSTAVAGGLGTALLFGLGYGVAKLLKKKGNA